MNLAAGQSFGFLGPELVLAATALVVWALGRGNARGGDVAVIGAALSVVLTAQLHGWGEVWLCDRLLVVDGVAIFAKLVIGLAVVAALWIEPSPRIVVAAIVFELVASAANAWVAAVAIELAFLAAASRAASLGESIAGLAVFASLGWLSGLAGSADLEALRAGLFEIAAAHGFAVSLASCLLIGAMLLRFGSIASRLDSSACGPLIAVGLPMAIVAFVSRFFFAALAEPSEAGRWVSPDGLDWRPALALAAASTMVWGGAVALRAPALGPLLGATAIANLGYALIGLSATSVEGLGAALFFCGTSAVATIGATLVASLVGSFDESRGLLRGRGVVHGAALALFLLSIAGAPLLAGFSGRGHVLAAAITCGEPALAGLGVLTVGVLLLAYARVLQILVTPGSSAPLARLPTDDLGFVALLGAVTVGIGLFPDLLVRFSTRSASLLPF